jgi:hypothetical protein
MIWVNDKTGRFPRRPHYEAGELDNECERITEDLIRQRKGSLTYPVATDDLLFALEQHAIVDHYADLPYAKSEEVWGVTNFSSGSRPVVRINRRLSEDPRFENPFRTTITQRVCSC